MRNKLRDKHKSLSRQPSSSPGILLVDDEESILNAIGKYFSAHNYKVDFAREMEEALALLTCNEYSVIIADLRLSGTDSKEGLAIVQYSKEHYPETRLIILTAYGSPDIELDAINRGVDAFLHKPLPLTELARVVEELLREDPDFAFITGKNT